MFFQTKSGPTILFQNTIQIEDDPNASKAVLKQQSYQTEQKKKQSQTSRNDRSFVNIVVI